MAWHTLPDYSAGGEAQIAETNAAGRRLLVRRTRLVGPQAELWPDWRYFPFITNRTEPLEVIEVEQRLRWPGLIGLLQPCVTLPVPQTVVRTGDRPGQSAPVDGSHRSPDSWDRGGVS